MRVEVWGESKLQLRYFVLITARKFIFDQADSHNVYVVLGYHPFTILTPFRQVRHFVTFDYFTPVELKVRFSRDYLHLITTNSTNRVLIQ